jgi:hypothetical protein
VRRVSPCLLDRKQGCFDYAARTGVIRGFAQHDKYRSRGDNKSNGSISLGLFYSSFSTLTHLVKAAWLSLIAEI